MSKFTRLGNQLYTGRKSIDFVGRRWLWYAISGVIVLVAVAGLLVRGLNLGVEFTGGAQYTVTVAGKVTQTQADELRTAIAHTGIKAAETPTVTTSGQHSLLIQTKEVSSGESAKIVKAITDTVHVDQQNVSQSAVGASWGKVVAQKALTGLIVFLVLVMAFIWIYFREWKMSVAAVVALAHDVVITVGVYALSGFEVTPATVTGFLTILGFSLYDTVVVFDKIRENTKDLRATRQTYAGAANLAVNQTLVRSINTSIVALLPVAAILWVSVVQLGASTLKDLALALFVGMAAGTYSSIFIATPLLVHLKSNENEVKLAEKRAKARARVVDPYAAVPAFSEDMPVEERLSDDDLDDEGQDVVTRPAPQPQKPATPLTQGRTAPQSRRPVRDSGASGRQQPSRKPRSER